MKKFLFPLTLLLIIALLSGCSMMKTMDAAEDHIEEKLEQSLFSHMSALPAVGENQITGGKAAEIALRHAGYTADSVQFLHTEYEIDDRIPEYSVDFFANGLEYEYTLHAESGTILSYDVDR